MNGVAARHGRRTTSPPKRPQKVRVSLHEQVWRTGTPLTVDREKGVIKGVKVLGWESVNGRRYLREAVKKALHFYEGCKVCINHPRSPTDSRDAEDVFGRLINVREDASGVWADLEYLKTHEMAAKLTEAAERMPEIFGLSHNAEGDGATDSDGTLIVSEIIDVRSVDVVAEPATTHGLAESRQSMAKKVKVTEYLAQKVYPQLTAGKARLKRFLEQEGFSASTLGTNQAKQMRRDKPDADYNDAQCVAEMEEPAVSSTSEDGMKMAMHAILDDDSLSPEECCKRLKDLLKIKAKHAAGGTDESEEDLAEESDLDLDVHKGKEGDSANIEEECAPGKMKESVDLKRRLRELERKDTARTLCESIKRPDLLAGDDGKVFLEALCRCPDEASMKALVKREQGRQPQRTNGARPNPISTSPRSSAGGQTLTEGVDHHGIPSAIEDRMRFLRNGAR